MKEPYKAKINDGRPIYIPNWPIDVSLENLTLAGRLLGQNNLINIASLNTAAAIVAIMSATDHKQTAALVKHFICQVRIDGSKISTETINEMFEGNLEVVLELFTHVIHSQYNDFFNLGLAKAPSLDK